MDPGALTRLPSKIASSPAICVRGQAIAGAGPASRVALAGHAVQA